jgi:hypothetical protein
MCVVVNAAIIIVGNFDHFSEKNWHFFMKINVRVIFCTKMQYFESKRPTISSLFGNLFANILYKIHNINLRYIHSSQIS